MTGDYSCERKTIRQDRGQRDTHCRKKQGRNNEENDEGNNKKVVQKNARTKE